MKAQELKSEDLGTLKQKLLDLLKEQFNTRMQLATGQLGQNHQVKQIRRDIARIKTVITQKEKGIE